MSPLELAERIEGDAGHLVYLTQEQKALVAAALRGMEAVTKYGDLALARRQMHARPNKAQELYDLDRQCAEAMATVNRLDYPYRSARSLLGGEGTTTGGERG